MRPALFPALILSLSALATVVPGQPSKATPPRFAPTRQSSSGSSLNPSHSETRAPASIKWSDALDQKPEWYGGDEAARIADNLLLYQLNNGGWPKNIEMAKVLTEGEKAALLKEKSSDTESTIDNGATYKQLAYLARVFTAKKIPRHKEAFLKGLDYLLTAQYDNGGWPQYYPLRKGYYSHITYNDNAMIGVMRLLRDIARKRPDYAFVDEDHRLRSERAVERGIECILKTQVVVEGKRTVWAAQHDERTLEPAPARKFEPAALTGSESVGIVRFLMGIERPGEQVVEAIDAAIAWFEKSKIKGIRYVERADASKIHGFDRVVVKDQNAGPLWARFYEIGTNRPIFIGRDARVRYDVAEIEDERRNGYSWYVAEPAELLNKDYPKWQKRWRQKSAAPAASCLRLDVRPDSPQALNRS
ncbi:MAG TPA: pectate lyase [Pyrinomonadaceae bacterium]|jgi:PelA/Pel-15E family pectate lyase